MNMWNGRIWFIAILIILILQISSNQILTPSFGTHKTQNVVWQTVVVSSEPVCTIFHYQLAQKYHIIAEEYFKLYQFETSRYQPECYSIENFDWKYDKPDDLDLLILIYDRDLGREKLHPYDIGGFYLHSGGDITHNHTIVFCECSTFRYSDPPWILSHELSHFILNYLGFDLTEVEDQIHYADYQYDYCMEENYDEFCKTIGAFIENEDLGSKIKVMKPYAPAIGMTPFGQISENVDFDSKGSELFKEITKWWHEGKITFSEYSESLKILTGQNFEEVSFGAYLRDSGTLVLSEPSKEIKVNSEGNLKHNGSVEMLKSFQFIEDPDPNSIFSGKYPDWFKNRALLWTSGKISDEEFAKSIELLKKSVIEIDENPPLTDNEIIDKVKLLVDDGEYDKALILVDSSIENNPKDPIIRADLFLLKGKILYELEQYSNALVFIDASLTIDSENIQALKIKGETLVNLGEEDQAQEVLDSIPS